MSAWEAFLTRMLPDPAQRCFATSFLAKERL